MTAEETEGGSPLCGRGPEACRRGRKQSSSDGVKRESRTPGDEGHWQAERRRGRPFSPHAPLKDNHSLIISYYYFRRPLPRVSALSGSLRSHRDLAQIPPNSPPSQAPAESPHPAASSPHPRIPSHPDHPTSSPHPNSFFPILPTRPGQSLSPHIIPFVATPCPLQTPRVLLQCLGFPGRSTVSLAASDVITQVPSVAATASAL